MISEVNIYLQYCSIFIQSCSSNKLQGLAFTAHKTAESEQDQFWQRLQSHWLQQALELRIAPKEESGCLHSLVMNLEAVEWINDRLDGRKAGKVVLLHDFLVRPIYFIFKFEKLIRMRCVAEFQVAREQGVEKHLMIINFQGNKNVAWRRRGAPVKRPSGWFHSRPVTITHR